MSTKVKELDNRHQGDRGACAICVPPETKGRVPLWKVWRWSLVRNRALIGTRTKIGSHVVIGERVEIGRSCKVEDGANE